MYLTVLHYYRKILCTNGQNGPPKWRENRRLDREIINQNLLSLPSFMRLLFASSLFVFALRLKIDAKLTKIVQISENKNLLKKWYIKRFIQSKCSLFISSLALQLAWRRLCFVHEWERKRNDLTVIDNLSQIYRHCDASIDTKLTPNYTVWTGNFVYH